MKSSAGRKALAVAVGVLALGALAARLNVPRIAGPIKGDEATYVAMAFSLAEDFDLEYRPEDYQRFQRLYGSGPEGVFLKRTDPSETAFHYGKAFIYSLAAAPFAGLMGLGGLLLFNVLLLAVDAWCAVLFCRARTGRPAAGTLLGLGFVGASVVPVYAVWLTPEIFNVSLIFIAYFLWLYKEVAPPTSPAWLRNPKLDWVAGLLIGVATFSKPTHAPLIAPIVATLLIRRQWTRAAAAGVAFAVATAGLFWVNAAITGDPNYQGGDRRYFVTNFPFDEKRTPFSAGNPMATEEANDENIFAPGYVAATLPKNVLYFFVGRHAGLAPYFFPGALMLALWLVKIRRSAVWQWTTALGCAAATGGLLLIAPEVWNGGGGPIGNRYFLSIYPTLLFLLPAGVGLPSSLVAWTAGLVSVGPILLHPFAASRTPWHVSERWPLRLLPIELTILNQLPVALNPQRWRVKVSGDPEVYLYYMDGRTYFQEEDGFWVAPGTAQIVVRTERPLALLDLRLRSSVDNAVDISLGDRSEHLELPKNVVKRIQLRPKPGWYALRSYQIIWTITTARGFYPRDLDPASTDTRHLGVFISPIYKVN